MATMKSMSLAAIAGTLAWLCSAAAHAADAPARAVPAQPVEASAEQTGKEPAIKRTVIEDDSARIEELRVRGQLQKVTVDPKGRAPSYEIIVGERGHDFSEGRNPTRAAGKRVWNVFRF